MNLKFIATALVLGGSNWVTIFAQESTVEADNGFIRITP